MGYLDTSITKWTDEAQMGARELMNLRDAFKDGEYDAGASALISIVTAPFTALSLIFGNLVNYGADKATSNSELCQMVLDDMLYNHLETSRHYISIQVETTYHEVTKEVSSTRLIGVRARDPFFG